MNGELVVVAHGYGVPQFLPKIKGKHLVMPDRQLEKVAEIVAAKVMETLRTELSYGSWLTVKEAMAYAKVKSKTTMFKWIHDGRIYAHKRSGEWIIDRESIDDWFNSERI